ncbi:hypothetical protein AAG906_006879 [Vitis piasezkii]
MTSFEISSNSNRLNGKKLNGKFFLEWSHSTKLFLRSKKKMGYILGVIKTPKTIDPLFES